MEGLVLAGRYRLESQLGRGGMGSVWRATHLSLGTPAAVKLIDPEIASDPEALARFKREAQAAAALRSPHVVQILDYGVADGTPFIAMELLDGESLEDRLSREGRLDPSATATVITHVARAVARAHEQGVVHRDLKPDNIHIVRNDDEEVAKVLDFGIAKQTDGGLGPRDKVETKTGAMMGTPFYMSPEQASGKRAIDHRTDIWALGVIAYECLTGRLPFESDVLGGLILSICMEDPPPPSTLWRVPEGFDEWFARATAKDPDERFQSAREAAKLLRELCMTAPERTSLDSVPDGAVLEVEVEAGQAAETEVARDRRELPTLRGEDGARTNTNQASLSPSGFPRSGYPIPLVKIPQEPEGPGSTGRHLSPSAVTVRTMRRRSPNLAPWLALAVLVVAGGGVGAYLWLQRSPPRSADVSREADAVSATTASAPKAEPAEVLPERAPEPVPAEAPSAQAPEAEPPEDVASASAAPAPPEEAEPPPTVARPAPPTPPPRRGAGRVEVSEPEPPEAEPMPQPPVPPRPRSAEERLENELGL